jgi:hypothetical protein
MTPARCYKCGSMAINKVIRVFPSGCRCEVSVCPAHTTRYDIYAEES